MVGRAHWFVTILDSFLAGWAMSGTCQVPFLTKRQELTLHVKSVLSNLAIPVHGHGHQTCGERSASPPSSLAESLREIHRGRSSSRSPCAGVDMSYIPTEQSMSPVQVHAASDFITPPRSTSKSLPDAPMKKRRSSSVVLSPDVKESLIAKRLRLESAHSDVWICISKYPLLFGVSNLLISIVWNHIRSRIVLPSSCDYLVVLEQLCKKEPSHEIMKHNVSWCIQQNKTYIKGVNFNFAPETDIFGHHDKLPAIYLDLIANRMCCMSFHHWSVCWYMLCTTEKPLVPSGLKISRPLFFCWAEPLTIAPSDLWIPDLESKNLDSGLLGRQVRCGICMHLAFFCQNLSHLVCCPVSSM